jgi:hypothetical protein
MVVVGNLTIQPHFAHHSRLLFEHASLTDFTSILNGGAVTYD